MDGFFGERSEMLCDDDWENDRAQGYVLYSKWVVTGSDGRWPDPPPVFVDSVCALVTELKPDGDLHWLHTFTGNYPDQPQISEALLNNQLWVKAESEIGALDWPA
ncbi:MAG: DUF6348 family protein [Pseudomonadales bacterium]|nr:DUF6348 family protein [Pseudomonadales bacterium]MDP6469779.1 DUF6348 family protein [Pseudomonadales bacterium]MDP6827618.1 DUF6348 family protein [Pseudomonadales bacterium]MDP6972423.1 DUF6348 family protein [Pseudomonadales bacterium]